MRQRKRTGEMSRRDDRVYRNRLGTRGGGSVSGSQSQASASYRNHLDGRALPSLAVAAFAVPDRHRIVVREFRLPFDKATPMGILRQRFALVVNTEKRQ